MKSYDTQKVIRIYKVSLIDSPDDTFLWSQGWRKETDLGLEGNLAHRLDDFLEKN